MTCIVVINDWLPLEIKMVHTVIGRLERLWITRYGDTFHFRCIQFRWRLINQTLQLSKQLDFGRELYRMLRIKKRCERDVVILT
jgi:hypothetical protein